MVVKNAGEGVPLNRRKADDSYCGGSRWERVLGTHLVGGFLFACKSAGGFWLSTPARSSAKVNVTRDRSIVAPDRGQREEGDRNEHCRKSHKRNHRRVLPEIGGATVGLTILGLAGASPVFLVEIATVLLCVGYLVRLVAKASEPEPAFLRARRRIRSDGA